MSMENPPPVPIDPEVTARARRHEDFERRRLRRLKVMFPFLLVLVFVAWGFTTNFIPSTSMLPNLKVGDHIITMRAWLAFPMGGMPQRGDIVIFRLPNDNKDAQADSGADAADGATQDKPKNPLAIIHRPDADTLVKRVIGLPGETVQVVGNDVLINGKKIEEDYQRIPVDPSNVGGFAYAVDEPLKVPEGEVFVLGDNRNNSDDGRFWGTLKRGQIIGKFVRVMWNEGEGGPNTRRAEKSDQAQKGQRDP